MICFSTSSVTVFLRGKMGVRRGGERGNARAGARAYNMLPLLGSFSWTRLWSTKVRLPIGS